MQNHIEKSIEVKAPIARVWHALTDHQAFGEWFCVKLDGPFLVGEVSRGHITYPGYEHIKWEAKVQAMEPEKLFAFTWHPYAIEPDVDYSSEPPTLVEFRLEPISSGTRVNVLESGFSALPEGRRLEALRMNESGWEIQVSNVQAYVES